MDVINVFVKENRNCLLCVILKLHCCCNIEFNHRSQKTVTIINGNKKCVYPAHFKRLKAQSHVFQCTLKIPHTNIVPRNFLIIHEVQTTLSFACITEFLGYNEILVDNDFLGTS